MLAILRSLQCIILTDKYAPLSGLPSAGRVDFIYLGFYFAFNTVQVISRRVVGRAEETSTYSSSGFCTVSSNNSKQLPAFPLEAMSGTEHRPQRREARVLRLCHHGPFLQADLSS